MYYIQVPLGVNVVSLTTNGMRQVHAHLWSKVSCVVLVSRTTLWVGCVFSLQATGSICCCAAHISMAFVQELHNLDDDELVYTGGQDVVGGWALHMNVGVGCGHGWVVVVSRVTQR